MKPCRILLLSVRSYFARTPQASATHPYNQQHWILNSEWGAMKSSSLLTTSRFITVVERFVCTTAVTSLGSLHNQLPFTQLSPWSWSNFFHQRKKNKAFQAIDVSTCSTSDLHGSVGYLLSLQTWISLSVEYPETLTSIAMSLNHFLVFISIIFWTFLKYSVVGIVLGSLAHGLCLTDAVEFLSTASNSLQTLTTKYTFRKAPWNHLLRHRLQRAFLSELARC